MVLCKPYPPDIRVEKEIRSLIEADHDLFVLAERRDGELKNDRVSGAAVDRHTPPHTFRRRLDWIRFQTSFRSSFWRNRIRNFVKRNSLDILHVHDLPFVGTTLDVAAEFDLPVVADMHENYPAAKQLWNEGIRDPLVWFGDDYRRWERYEREILPLASEVITVVDEAAQRLQESKAVDSKNMTVIMNVEERSWFDELATSDRIDDDKIRIVYVGGVRPHRGLDIVITALSELPKEHKVSLRIVGARGQYAEELKELTIAMGIEGRVELVEWIPLEEVPNAIIECDIGMVPHQKHPHTDATIPHKLFQYMLASKPVIVSNCKPLERIVKETKSGLVFDSGNPSDLATKLLELITNSKLCLELGLNGRKTALARYNWEIEGQKLVNLYDKFQ
jgi:glycosyltransferase involved in cell wall biosynthesis